MIQTIDDLIDFLKVYHRPWMTDTRLDPGCIRTDLPESLQKLYRELGALLLAPCPYAFGTALSCQDKLLLPDRLKIEGGEIVFATENQGNWSASVRPGEASLYVSTFQGGAAKIADTVDEFLITLCLQEAVHSAYSHGEAKFDDAPDGTLWSGLWVPGAPPPRYDHIPSAGVITRHESGRPIAYYGSQMIEIGPRDLDRLSDRGIGELFDAALKGDAGALESMVLAEDPRSIGLAQRVFAANEVTTADVWNFWERWCNRRYDLWERLDSEYVEYVDIVLTDKIIDLHPQTFERIAALTQRAAGLGKRMQAEWYRTLLESRRRHLEWARARLDDLDPAILIEALHAIARYADIQMIPQVSSLANHASETVRRESEYALAALEYFACEM